MNHQNVTIKPLFPDVTLPSKQTTGSVGYDIYSYTPKQEIIIEKNKVEMIPTGFALEIPEGFDVEIRPRSGISTKHKVIIPNSPGTIDSDYRGEIFVPFFNLGDSEFLISHKMRIAQLILRSSYNIEWQINFEISPTPRGKGGFGSTG